MVTATETARQRWPSAAKRAVADDLRGQFHVRIGQNDDVILRAALALHALAAGRGARVNVLGDGSRADETDGAHLRMVAKRIHDVRPPLTRFTTPLGKPVFSRSSKARRIESGTRSDGFRMKVFPQAMA